MSETRAANWRVRRRNTPKLRNRWQLEWFGPDGRTRTKIFEAGGPSNARVIGLKLVEKYAPKWSLDCAANGTKMLSPVTEEIFNTWLELVRPSRKAAGYAREALTIAGVSITRMTPQAVARIQKYYVRQKRHVNTIATKLRSFRSLMRWAKRSGLIRKCPKIVLPRCVSTPKGRALTADEIVKIETGFESIFTAHPAKAAEWKRLVRLMVASGLRINEAVHLTWDKSPDKTYVDWQSHDWPVLVTPAAGDKARIERTWPLHPDAWRIIEVPPEARHGMVLRLMKIDSWDRVTDTKLAIRYVSWAGFKSGVQTDPGKFATSHDLRRTFCLCIAQDSRLTQLQQMALMRHRSIQTTVQYYIGRDLKALGDSLWRGVGAAVAGSVKGGSIVTDPAEQ